jgi:hypothetical protein
MGRGEGRSPGASAGLASDHDDPAAPAAAAGPLTDADGPGPAARAGPLPGAGSLGSDRAAARAGARAALTARSAWTPWWPRCVSPTGGRPVRRSESA